MYLILNIGATGTGKSTLINDEFIKKGRKVFVFDQQNEYPQLPWYKKDDIQPQMRFYGDPEGFYRAWKTLKRGYNIVVEEATGIYEGRATKEVIRFILSKRHIGMNFICNFHFVQACPKNLIAFADILFLRKTGDQIEDVRKKLRRYEKDWVSVMDDPDPYAFKMLKISNLTK